MKTLLRIFLAMIVWCLTFSAPKAHAGEKISHFDLISFERTKCYGTCPTYWMDIRSDGKVQYLGKGNVKTQGPAKTKISPEQIEKLIEAVNAVNYFDLRDSYPDQNDHCPILVTDHPSVIIRIRVGDRDKTVTHYHGCFEDHSRKHIYPRDLTEFESKIDEIVGTSMWTGKD